jgi:hypothetical protein
VVCGSLWFVLFSLCFNSQPNIECRLKSNKEMRETCHLDESRGNELRMISTCVHTVGLAKLLSPTYKRLCSRALEVGLGVEVSSVVG